MKNNFVIQLALLLGTIMMMAACNKNSFLDKKPSTKLVVPSSLEDFQSLLDNDNTMNVTPVIGELASDNYYMPFNDWQAIYATHERNSYICAKDIYEGKGGIEDWNFLYKQIFYANAVLEGLDKLDPGQVGQQQWNEVKGSALFFRSYAFYNLAMVFAMPYDVNTAGNNMGIPLRLTANVNVEIKRATLKETMDQILKDLHEACRLLPVPVAEYRNRPSRPAAAALLGRVYLSIRDYSNAGLYADSCLRMYNKLLDFKNLAPGTFAFSRANDEVLFQGRFTSTSVLAALISPGTIVDSTLMATYKTGDLRSQFYLSKGWTGAMNPGANYSQTIFQFTGLATDEAYLIRAESYARAGKPGLAMDDINTLLKNRMTAASYIPLTATDGPQALAIVLEERRKELPFRGVRFTDLKRLNQEGYNIVVRRSLNGQTYELAANDLRYAFPIPPDEINCSGIPQNNR